MDTSGYTAGEFLKPKDTQESQVDVIIAKEPVMEEKDFKNDGKVKAQLVAAVAWKGKEWRLAINKTNAAPLQKAWGFDSKAWVGKTVRLEKFKTRVNGELKDAWSMSPIGGASTA